MFLLFHLYLNYKAKLRRISSAVQSIYRCKDEKDSVTIDLIEQKKKNKIKE
jgi:hypothetical protein